MNGGREDAAWTRVRRVQGTRPWRVACYQLPFWEMTPPCKENLDDSSMKVLGVMKSASQILSMLYCTTFHPRDLPAQNGTTASCSSAHFSGTT
jgi:hypothetical protein